MVKGGSGVTQGKVVMVVHCDIEEDGYAIRYDPGKVVKKVRLDLGVGRKWGPVGPRGGSNVGSVGPREGGNGGLVTTVMLQQ